MENVAARQGVRVGVGDGGARQRQVFQEVRPWQRGDGESGQGKAGDKLDGRVGRIQVQAAVGTVEHREQGKKGSITGPKHKLIREGKAKEGRK